MSTRWKLAAILMLSVAVAFAILLVAPFDYAKSGTIFQLRRSLPQPSQHSIDSAEKTTVRVAFDQAPSTDNLFFANGREVYEQRGRHRLVVRFDETDPEWEVVSYVTSILYLDERMNTLSFHPLEARATYRQVVAAIAQLFRQLGLHEKVRWDEYEQRLDTAIEMHEVYVPKIELPSAIVQPYMNCNWDVDELPRKQVDRVECYPIVYVTPTKRAAALPAR